MLLNNKKVAIIGAGPVGLTMAKLLQKRGIAVSVYERDKDTQRRISGGTLDLHKGSGQDAMIKAGLLERYFSMSIPMGRTVADEDGNVLFSKKPTPEDQYDNPEINRNDLRQLLLDSLITGTVTWDRTFIGLSAHDGKWLLHFENNSNATADFVIGANGGMSKVRKYLTDAQIEYTGSIIIQGEVFQPEMTCTKFYQLCNDNILMTADKGNLLVANPRTGSILCYNVIFKHPQILGRESKIKFQDTNSIIEFLLTRYAHWDESYKQLFRSTSSFILLPTRKISLDKTWVNNSPLPITLIGDAAHIMPPFAGQGVNIGLKDALILSDNLTSEKFETIQAAIKDYEIKMFVYAKEAQLETSKNETQMQDPNFSFLKFYQ